MSVSKTLPETDLGFLQSIVNDEVAVIKTTSVTTLEIDGMPGADEIAESCHSILSQRTLRDLPDSLSPDRIKEACEALEYLRIRQVQRRPKNDIAALSHRVVAYPAVLFPLLRAIGEINDIEDAVRVKVTFGPTLARFDDQSYDWQLIVDTLQALEDYGVPNGLEMAYGLPKGLDGRLSVVILCVDNGRVKSSQGKANPADLLIRAAYDFVVTDYVWGSIRWEYQSVSDYRYQLQQLVRATFRTVK